MILAANHVSNLDGVLLGGWVIARVPRRIHWLGKREMFELPIVRGVLHNYGVHPVDRSGADIEAFRTAQGILEAGQALLIFPEGTRSRDGSLQKARDGLADARPANRRPDRSDRRCGHGQGLAEGPQAAPVARRACHGPHRHPVPRCGRDPGGP